MTRPAPIRSVRDDAGNLYLSADDLRQFIQHRDVVYHCGCMLKVHMEKKDHRPPIEPGWKGAVKSILGGALMIAMGEAEIITDPDGIDGRN